jgi:hypothetical protein
MTTELSIPAIEAMLARITPGEWHNEGRVVADKCSIVVGDKSYDWRFVAHVNSDTDDDATGTPIINEAEAKANAEFIAAAPIIVRWLLGRLEETQAQVAQLQAELDALKNGIVQAAIKTGIIDYSTALTRPQLLMLCEDLAQDARVERLQAQLDGVMNCLAQCQRDKELLVNAINPSPAEASDIDKVVMHLGSRLVKCYQDGYSAARQAEKK